MYCHEGHIYTRKLKLDLVEQREIAHYMHNKVIKLFCNDSQKGSDKPNSQMLTKLFAKYNYLLHPHPGIHKLYQEIKNLFYTVSESDEPHFIQCWVNFYYKGGFIDWHAHWMKEFNAWHGFYCLDVEPDSSTTYQFGGWPPKLEILPGMNPITRNGTIFDIKSENNLIVIGKSGEDHHRSSEWKHDNPRITVAFDVVPANKLYTDEWALKNVNHWIPI